MSPSLKHTGHEVQLVGSGIYFELHLLYEVKLNTFSNKRGYFSSGYITPVKGRCKGGHRDRKRQGPSCWPRPSENPWPIGRNGWHAGCCGSGWGHTLLQNPHTQTARYVKVLFKLSATVVYTDQNTCADLIPTVYLLICLVNKWNTEEGHGW